MFPKQNEKMVMMKEGKRMIGRKKVWPHLLE
jgi:hypothetical protein